MTPEWHIRANCVGAGELRALLTILFCGAVITVSGCTANSHAERGTAVGGATGAVAGTMIGAQSGNAGKGAVIGTMAGMVAGNLIGQDMDQQEIAREKYYTEAYARERENAVSIAQLIEMSEAGVADEVIIAKIQEDGPREQLSTDDIITLTKRNVSSDVIKAYQARPIRELPPSRRTSRDPVIIERHYLQPAYPAGPRSGAYYRHSIPHGRTQWGLSIQN